MNFLPLVLRLLSSIYGKRLADRTAVYLNDRRVKRLTGISKDIPITEVVAKKVVPRRPKKIETRVETRVVKTPAKWHVLSGALMGAALTLILGLLWIDRAEDDEFSHG